MSYQFQSGFQSKYRQTQQTSHISSSKIDHFSPDKFTQQQSPSRLTNSVGGMSTKTKIDAGYFVEEKEAKAIARRIFDHYDKDRSGVIEPHEMEAMICDAYKGVNNHFTPTANHVKSYTKIHDKNGDGYVTIEDMEKTVKKYLCFLDDDYQPQQQSKSIHYDKSFVRQETEKDTLMRKVTKTFSKEVVEAELLHAKKVFEKYDLNRNGFLEFDEVTPMLKDTYKVMGNNYQPSRSDTLKYIEMMDTDGDERISLEEYEVFVLKALQNRGINL